MRKDLNVKLSWMSEDNWKFFIEQGFLPILAINHPRHNSGTRVHFPELAPKMKVLRKFENPGEEYYNWLSEKVNKWEILHTLDVLAHLASASGVIILTEKEDDPFRKILGAFLDGILDEKITEYEWDREDSRNLDDI